MDKKLNLSIDLGDGNGWQNIAEISKETLTDPPRRITFTEAAEILLDGGKITFVAGNNKAPEADTIRFEIDNFQTLCDEYRLLRVDYFDIELYLSN